MVRALPKKTFVTSLTGVYLFLSSVSFFLEIVKFAFVVSQILKLSLYSSDHFFRTASDEVVIPKSTQEPPKNFAQPRRIKPNCLI